MNHRIFAIEIKDNYIKTAFVESDAPLTKLDKKEQIIVNFNAVRIKSKEDRKNILLYLANKYGKLKSKIVVALADNSFITRDIKLPTSNNQEIISMLSFQIPRLSPFSTEEIVFDYFKINEDNSGYSDLFIPIIQKTTINELYALAKEVNFNISNFRLGAEAVVAAIKYFKSKDKVFSDLDNFICLNLDNFDTSIIAVRNNKISFLRNIPFGASDIKKSFVDFKVELNTTFLNIKNKLTDLQFDKIFVAGVDIDNDLKRRFRDECGDKFIFINPLECVDNIKFNIENKSENLSYLACLGLLLNNQILSFSPHQIIKKGNSGNLVKYVLSKTALLLYISILLISSILIIKFNEKKEILREFDKRLKSIDLDISSIKESLLIAQIEKEDLIEMLSEFYGIIPQDIALDNLSYNYNQDFVIKGKSSNLRQINNFLNLLKESRHFNNAQLKYAIKNKTDNGEKVNFQIDFYLKQR
ncbi:MAG: PilN domain-containing protein [Patescibacteria group bacterium]